MARRGRGALGARDGLSRARQIRKVWEADRPPGDGKGKGKEGGGGVERRG